MKFVARSVLLLFCILSFPNQPIAGSETYRVRKRIDAATEIRQETQKKEDKWASQKAELEAEYHSLKERSGRLEEQREKAEMTLKLQRGRVAELERKLTESARVRDELHSHVDGWVTRLEDYVARDLPFLPEERKGRVSSMRRITADPGIETAEKLRRVMEALQVETEYGGTVEVYQDTIELSGQSTLVNVFRLGRLSLFYQTPDRKEVGHYNRASGTWEPLAGKYRHAIDTAVEMGNRQRPIELITLPIGRIVP